MVKANTPGRKQGSGKDRSTVGGTAIQGAKSTQPKQFTENASPQQQQLESYNREMRRRMERMGQTDQEDRMKKAQDKRKERMERIKERRQNYLSQAKKSLPGGKLDTSPRRVYMMIAVVAIAIIALIVVFVILRATGALG